MTTKTNITLPPLPEPDGIMTIIVAGREVEIGAYRASTMIVHSLAAVEADRQGRTPSDAEIVALSRQKLATARTDNMIAFARALLARYSSGQPAASAEPELSGMEKAFSSDAIARREERQGLVPTGSMTDEMRDAIEGMSVSVDVSTGDHDAGHRYFGTVTEVMDHAGDKHGVTLLVQNAEPNFDAPVAQEPVGTVWWRGSPYPSPLVEWRGRPPEDGTPTYAAPVAAQAQPRLYQHDDGCYGLSFGPAQFAVGDPAWHRVPIDVIDETAQPGAQDQEASQ